MSQPLRVLLVEDSTTDAKLVTRELRKLKRPVDHERVETEAEMRAALERAGWDVVISDWSLPRFSGLAALDLLSTLQPDVPFILVSGTIGEETAVNAMRAGVRDYVLKDKLERLAPAVERELGEHQQRIARRRAEQALRESEEEYRLLFDKSPLAKWLFDVETLRFLNVNEAAIREYGYTRSEFLQMTIREIRPAEDLPRLDAHLAGRAAETSGLWRHRRKDGTVFDVEVSGHTFTHAGRACRLVAVRDVSERKRLEEQLRHAQKMEAVGRLAGGIAHDFNNVLSIVLSYSELLLADMKPGDPARADIEEIARAGERAARLTRQLLMFSRQNVLEPRVLDLNELLANIDKMLRRILGADVNVVTIPGRALGHVLADAGSLEQVVMNLVVNARDAMPAGGRLTIETLNVELDEEYARQHTGVEPGPYVMLAVTDTGTGMDAATRARIFEPFFTTKEVGKGTGLGLSTVFGIVRQSGGSVWVYSEPGKGSTFKVYLPRVDAEKQAEAPAVATETLRGSETILLVDDDDQLRVVTRSILQRHGHEVLDARSPAEALDKSEDYAGAIDLLVTDVVMPGMSGPQLARQLATTRPAMKVLCMSGYTDDSVVRHGVLEGSMTFLQKPVTPQALMRKIRQLLDGRG